MLLTLSSVRGAPGVTSWTVLLAGAWPDTGSADRVVLEADCAGGVLGARYAIGVDPGAVSLISACRHADAPVDPAAHGRLLADGLWVVPGPEVGETAVPAWASGAADVAGRLAADNRVWLVDAGRLGPGSPLRPLADGADLNILVSRPGVEDLVQLPARLAALGPPPRTAVLLTGPPSHSRSELEQFLGGGPIWIAPPADDLPRLTAAAITGGRARRSGVWRAAVDLAAELAARNARRDRSNGTRPPQPLDRVQRAERDRPPVDRTVALDPASGAGGRLP